MNNYFAIRSRAQSLFTLALIIVFGWYTYSNFWYIGREDRLCTPNDSGCDGIDVAGNPRARWFGFALNGQAGIG